MRKIHLFVVITAIGIAAAAGIFTAFFYSGKKHALRREDTGARTTALPLANDADAPAGNAFAADDAYSAQKQPTPVFPLDDGEVFIQAVNADINGDGTYDQMCALRHISDPRIYIVCAIQNPVTGSYTRLPPLHTEIAQARTLLMYMADVTGDQRNSLVYSGINSENLQVMGIYLIEESSGGNAPFVSTKEILNIAADGTITLEETPRSEAYNQGYASGESYHVVSYNSIQDGTEGEHNFDQIQRTYRWDKETGVYVLSGERVISARNAGTRVLRQLIEGGVPAFSAFLKGLWYKTADGPETHQVFFDLDAEEIIFRAGATEEIFQCENISVRRYGIYLITRNRLISNIRRLIDIEITGTGEIRIRVTDDVRLKIGVGSIWDGSYRKLKDFTTAEKEDGAKIIRDKIEAEGTEWTDSAGNTYTFKSGVYTYSTPVNAETGKYTVYVIHGEPVMQMKKHNSGESVFYLIESQETDSAVLREVVPSTNGLKRTNSPALTITARQ